MRIWFDSEADGLLNEATKIWCAVFITEEGEKHAFTLDGSVSGKSVENIKEFILDHTDCEFICHNLFGYDLDLFRRILDIQYGMDWWACPTNRVKFTDTLDRSQSQWPDRPHPKGCPYVVYNPVTGKNKRIGPHGLESWGYRVARAKPEVHDWRNGTIEDYLHRCEEDTIITRKAHIFLDDEMERNKLKG